MRQLAALIGGGMPSARRSSARSGLARGVAVTALALGLAGAAYWLRGGDAAASRIAGAASVAPEVDAIVAAPVAAPAAPVPDHRAPATRPARTVAAVPAPRAGDAATLRAAFERVPDLYALSRQLAPLVAAGDAEALWITSRIHDYCAGYAMSPADYARDTVVLARLGGRGAGALRDARDRVAQRCGRFAPVDALTLAGILRQREQAALAGHLAAEASLLAMGAPLDDSPDYLRDLVARVQYSGDAEAFSALSPGMGVAASGEPAFAGMVAGTQFAEWAWQLAACRQGMDCGPRSTLMTMYCANGGICLHDGRQDFHNFMYDAAIPRQGAEHVERMVETLLQGVSGRVER